MIFDQARRCGYGLYSGATPNQRVAWDKLNKDTPMFVASPTPPSTCRCCSPGCSKYKANPEARKGHDPKARVVSA